MAKSVKTTERQLEVLRELAKPNAKAYYMRHMGSLNPTAYYFLSSSHKRCTPQIAALIDKGLVEVVKEGQLGGRSAVISGRGINYLASLDAPHAQ